MEQSLVLSRWQNTELHSIPATCIESFKVPVSGCWESMESFIHLLVPTTLIFSYYLKLSKAPLRGMEAVI